MSSTRIHHTAMIRLQLYRSALTPAWRGAIFYLGYWGVAGLFEPFLNVYFARLGLSGQQIGFLSALFPLMTLLAAPMLSALADRRAWRTSILGGLLGGLALALLLLWIPRTFSSLIPLMALLALVRSPIGPIGDSLVARMSVRYGLNYGNLRMWGSLSYAALAVACGALAERTGFALMFVAAGVLFLPVILSALILDEGPVSKQDRRRPVSQLAKDPGLVGILVATFLVGIGMQTIFLFGGIYMDDLGGGGFLVGLLFGLAAFCELPTMQYSDAIVRRLNGTNSLLLSYGLFGLSVLIYVFAWTAGVLLVTSLFTGLGFGLFFVATVRLIDERAPEEWSSTAQATMNASAFGLAPLLASLAGGWMYDTQGAVTLFAAAGVLVGCGALVLIAANARGLFAARVEPARGPGQARAELGLAPAGVTDLTGKSEKE